MLQHDVPEDFVLATGVTTTTRDFIIMAFDYIGIGLDFKREGIDEKVYVKTCSNPLYNLEERNAGYWYSCTTF